MCAPRGGPLSAPMSGGYRSYNPSVFASLLVPPWYVGNRQIHKDLDVPLFSYHIRAPTESSDSKIADVRNPLVRQLGRYLRWTRVGPIDWRESQGRQGPTGQSRSSPEMAKSTKRIAFGADKPSALRLPWLRFSRDFSSVGIGCKVGTGSHSRPPGAAASYKCLTNVAYLQFAREPVWTQKPDSQPTKVCCSHT